MLVSTSRISFPNPIWICISLVGILVLLTNFMGANILTDTANFLYSIATVFLLGSSIIMAKRFRSKGKHGKAWLMFLGFSTLWLSSQAVYIYNQYNDSVALPQIASALHHLGYVFLFMFTLFYIKPIESAITKPMLAAAFGVSLAMSMPSIYIAANFYDWVNETEHMISVIGPALNAVVIFPSVLGMILFFKGKVSFLWNSICLAISLCTIADTSLLFSCIPHDCDTSRTPLDMLYLWAYILFSFGVHSHIKIFKKYKMQYYENPEELR